MATNLSIDTRLLDEALPISGLKTKKNTFNQALKEFLQRRKLSGIAALFALLPHDC